MARLCGKNIFLNFEKSILKNEREGSGSEAKCEPVLIRTSEFGAPTVMRVNRANQNARVRLEYLSAENRMLCRMLVLPKANFQVKLELKSTRNQI